MGRYHSLVDIMSLWRAFRGNGGSVCSRGTASDCDDKEKKVLRRSKKYRPKRKGQMEDLMGILGIAWCFLRKTMLKRTWKSAMHEGGRFDCSLKGKSKLHWQQAVSGVSSPRSTARADATAASLSRKACIRGLPTHQNPVDFSLACAVSFGTAPLLHPAEADRKQHHLNPFAWQHKQCRGN